MEAREPDDPGAEDGAEDARSAETGSRFVTRSSRPSPKGSPSPRSRTTGSG